MRMMSIAGLLLLLAGCGREDPAPAEGANSAAPVAENAAAPPPASTVDPRNAGVLAMVKPADGDLSDKARVALAYADIGGDSREEALVYLVDPMWCGTGGCSLIVLTPSGDKWREVARTSVTQLPVHRLLTRKDGWNDLAVGIGGGGGKAGIALLRFTGKTYPDNPSVQPQLNRLPEGARELIADDYDHLLPVAG